MAAGPDTPLDGLPNKKEGWDRAEIDQLLEEVDEAAEDREEIINRLDKSRRKPTRSRTRRSDELNKTVQKTGIAISLTIALTVLAFYSLSHGFSQGSIPLIISSVFLFSILLYHNARWYLQVKND